MPQITIEQVQGSRGRRDFLEFPRTIYQDDPAWVPPVREWQRLRLSARFNAFLREAALVLLLARRHGEVVGTISVLRDLRHESHRREKIAFFGFFETIDDREVAHALLQAAEDQALEWGATVLKGPRNLSRVEERGVTVQGHDLPPPMLAGHHPAHYQGHIESWGMTRDHDALAYDIELYLSDGSERPFPPDLLARAQAVEIPGLEVRPFAWGHLARDMDLCHRVMVEAFRDVPDNTPLPRAQFYAIMGTVLGFTSRHMLQIATVHGEAAGFALCFPDIYEALIASDGHLLPLGWARAVGARDQMRTGSFKLLGVTPEHRGTGLHARLIVESIHGLRAAGYTRLEASLIDERNGPMRHIVESAGCEVYKRLRVYRKDLQTSGFTRASVP